MSEITTDNSRLDSLALDTMAAGEAAAGDGEIYSPKPEEDRIHVNADGIAVHEDGVPVGNKTSDYWFYLPKKQIAQDPLEQRDLSRMMVIDRYTGEVEHKIFRDIIDYLEPGETLVLNNTKVIPARSTPERRSRSFC